MNTDGTRPAAGLAACSVCRDGRFLVEQFAAMGAEVHVQRWTVFLKPTVYEDAIFKCPNCKTWWWAEPTNDQILDWHERGVE